jgi:hypothetical protein
MRSVTGKVRARWVARVLHTCLFLGFPADPQDREEGEIP